MKKEILFSVGGGIVCYQMGIIKWILENIDQNYLRQECIFGGASAGSVASFFLVCCLHGIGDIDSWFNEIILKLFNKIKKSKTGALFKINKMVAQVGKDIEKRITRHQDISFLNNKYHILVTKIPEMKKKIITQFNYYDDFIQAIITSCYAPLISHGFCYKYKNDWCSDGIYCYQIPSRDYQSSKVYFSFFNQQENNCHTINICNWKSVSLKDVWMWSDLNWCKRLYYLGYMDSNKHKQEIISSICPIQSPLTDFYNQLLLDLKNQKKDTSKPKNSISKKIEFFA